MQFAIDDNRTCNQVIQSLCNSGFLPSYCRACYRQGRTGERFMRLARTGEIQNVCLPNGILTFMEYLMDYGDDETKQAGESLIEGHLKMIPSEKIREQTKACLDEIKGGKRDIYF